MIPHVPTEDEIDHAMLEARVVTATTLKFWEAKVREVLESHSVVRNHNLSPVEVSALCLSIGFFVGKSLIEDCAGYA